MKEVLRNYLDQEGLEEDDILSPLFTIEEENKRMKYRGIHQEEVVPINMIAAPHPEPGPRRAPLSFRPSNSTDDLNESRSSSRQSSVNSIFDGEASDIFDQQGGVVENADSVYQEQPNEVCEQQPAGIEIASREETLRQVMNKEDTNIEKRKKETLNTQSKKPKRGQGKGGLQINMTRAMTRKTGLNLK